MKSINFISEIVSRQMQKQPITWLYVLRLKDDHYYVGTTKDLSGRFEDHWAGKAAAWTTKYPPTEVVSVARDKSVFEEDAKVKELMSIYGILKVRGGSYSKCELSQEQIKMLEHELKHGKGECFVCGSKDHWVKDCPKNNKLVCSRCGRDSHTKDKCYAKVNTNGIPIIETNFNDFTVKEIKLLLNEKKIDYFRCKLKADYVALAEKSLG